MEKLLSIQAGILRMPVLILERGLRAAIGYDKGADDQRQSSVEAARKIVDSRANRSKKLILVNTTAGRGSICI